MFTEDKFQPIATIATNRPQPKRADPDTELRARTANNRHLTVVEAELLFDIIDGLNATLASANRKLALAAAYIENQLDIESQPL